MSIQRTFSGAPWESKVSYCRAIRMGSHIAISGTTSVDDQGNVYAPEDPYSQTLKCLEIIENSLKEFGMDRNCVMRTRMFVTDISRWEEFGRAHGEFFKNCPPATSMIEVKGLIDPGLLIEVEADAVYLEK
jgi:enamine deaminase RidA (YjgF/YER057c/UK114 family)